MDRPRSAARTRSTAARFAAALLVGVVLVAGCGGAEDEASGGDDPHAGHGGGTVDPLRPIAGDPVALRADEDLYAVPDPLPAGEHGTLLAHQEIPSPVPGATAHRILHLGRSLSGEPTAISGTVLVPTTAAPAGGRLVVGVAPAATGLGDDCAPSRTLDGEIPALASHVEAGHLVVVTDGEGVGTPGLPPALVASSAGHTLLDAVRAARALPGAEASEHVGLAGTAEGGHAALWAATLAAGWTPDLDVVGTVAGAPATDLGAVLEHPEAVAPYDVLVLVSGLAAASRFVDPASYLTEAGLEALEVVRTTCRTEAEGALAALAVTDLVLPAGPATGSWVAAAAANDPATTAADDSVLVLPDADPIALHAEAAAWLTARPT